MARSRRPQSAATASRKQPQASSGSTAPGRWLALALLLVTIAGGAWWLFRPAPAGPIILISIDTLRADHLSLYGYTRGRTLCIGTLGFVHRHLVAKLCQCVGQQAAHQARAQHHT